MSKYLGFLLYLLAAPFFAPMPAAAAACNGKDLLAELHSQDPSAYASLMAEAESVANGESVLWKIEKEGIAPSFLFGTMHITDERVTGLSEPVRNALADARTVAMELSEIRDKHELMKATMRHARFLAMPGGKSLWDIIPDEFEEMIAGSPNLPAERRAAISAFQPWVVATMISIPACEQERVASGLLTMDEIIAGAAARRNLELVGLETIEQQLSTFSAMSLETQADYLVGTARLGSTTNDYFETMIRLYLDRRLAALLPLSRRAAGAEVGSARAFAFIEKELIEKRNLNMHQAAIPLLARGRVFIAVGALHLPGTRGLVELFRQSGFTLTALN
jgi:hypothetical protein